MASPTTTRISAMVEGPLSFDGPGCSVSDPDSGIEDDRLGFDLEDDYCLAHEDHGTGGFLTAGQRQEVRRVKVACREIQRSKY